MLTYLLYIDPGAGSYLIQALIAAALSVAFFFKNILRFFSNGWLLIKSLFTRSSRQNKN